MNPFARIQRIGWLELCLLLSVLALVSQLFGQDLIRWWQERPIVGQQTPGSAVITDPRGRQTRIHYLIYLPKDYSSSIPFPLLLYLHGSGRRGDDLGQLKNEGPSQLLAKGKALPLIVVSPQCAAGASWAPSALLDLLNQLKEKFSIDPSRIYVAGYSMGGYGAWELIGAAPAEFAAAVPVAAGGRVSDAARLLEIPIWSFHGAHDKTIPLDADQKMIDAIQAGGGKYASLTVLDQGHGICDLVFARDDLYEWLLKQRRTDK